MDVHRRLTFYGEWFQEEAGVSRQFYVYFYPADKTIEIFEEKTKKIFLKRIRIEGLCETDFYVGAKINVFGRIITILNFADTTTENTITGSRKRTMIIIKPDGLNSLGEILGILESNGFRINNGRMLQFNNHDIVKFIHKTEAEDNFGAVVDYLSSEPVVGFELVADDAIEKLKNLCGPSDVSRAKQISPNSIRALYGINDIKNGVHCSESEKHAFKEIQFFFGKSNGCKPTHCLQDSTLCIIKPHAVKEGKIGKIISEIYRNGFKITALKMLLVERQNAAEFYEVYKGVLPEYMQMVSQLCSGLCVAIEVKSIDDRRDTYTEFRNLCGPIDPVHLQSFLCYHYILKRSLQEIGIQLRPNTLRAKYGKSKLNNAVHCTDLREDALLEIDYFFNIID